MEHGVALIIDGIGHADAATVARAEDYLHRRIAARRERDMPIDDIRDALALCHARRCALMAE